MNPGLGPIADGWDLVGPPGWGTPGAGGSQLLNIQFGQFPDNALSIRTTNPINLMYQALWTPASYSPRDLTFALSAALPASGFASSVHFKTSTTGIAAANCNSIFNNLTISIPAPATCTVLTPLLLARRRRRGPPP